VPHTAVPKSLIFAPHRSGRFPPNPAISPQDIAAQKRINAEIAFKPVACTLKHRRGDIRPNDNPRRSNGRERH
jgi:hypothetical protein